MLKRSLLAILSLFLLAQYGWAQEERAHEKFKQLYEELPTPNQYHNAAGAPGHKYWQQRADYNIQVRLDDEKQRIYGKERIAYYNNSPDELSYLWLQLDQNVRAQGSDAQITETQKLDPQMYSYQVMSLFDKFDGGFKIEKVSGKKGENLKYTINKTMMRIDLDRPLKPGEKFEFDVKWWYNINDGIKTRARSGYEYFPEDDNYMYNIAQFYPRMCAYNSVDGWQNKQFMGRGEFTLSFGNFNLEITVPKNFIVGATGVLQNSKDVLSKTQRERIEKARTAKDPVFIITEEEAKANESKKGEGSQTWRFYASNVRDVAFVASRKLIWDAQGVQFGDRNVLAISYYPKECMGLWDKYSTRAVVHTLKTYSKYTFDYPYPVAISSHTNFTGMEYPMICFNYGRPRPDGTYSERLKYGMIGVIIHEIGHNYFPMIVNSDERQWTWMDEGLNTFLQYLTEVEWERDYPCRRGPAYKITDYMGGDKNGIVPIMTNSESILQFGNNAYGKPATALNILRETIMGRELFDHAFKEYANRWKFKHPTPADFFRTMEDASGVDLDWFWRGWFYGTDHVDIALDEITHYHLNTFNPEQEMSMQKIWDAEDPTYIGDIRNKESVKQTVMERYPDLHDKYNDRDKYRVDEETQRNSLFAYQNLSAEEKEVLAKDYNYYQVDFKNVGGLVMPIIIELKYVDGSSEVRYIPAEIWRYNSNKVSKVFVTEKEIKEFILDPYLETADVERENNYFPRRRKPTRFEMFSPRQ
ncbi:M1 family metallopeptidase [Saprospira grandis]|uniref:M1 family metallopeptidase n=1 Tax=Saprospira grandis TaxID=1008 RepID=UPI0022DDE204|nr:M1 family metallopeptidase [Saprospira grandis]WBM76163.1 M1 family metallopeptidase [Saprospira grandis]